MKWLLCQSLDVTFSEKVGVSVGDEKAKVGPQPTCHVENGLSCPVIAPHGVGFKVVKKLQYDVEIVSLNGPIVQ